MWEDDYEFLYKKHNFHALFKIYSIKKKKTFDLEMSLYSGCRLVKKKYKKNEKIGNLENTIKSYKII